MRKLKGFYLLLITGLMLFMTLVGCEKEEPIEYGGDIGVVDGNINFKDDEEPEIKLSNIKSYVGAEVDYLSRINVSDPDKYDEMEIWVDASLVDIFTPGDYKATYTFVFAKREYVKDIIVTIISLPEASMEEIISSDILITESSSDTETDATDKVTTKYNETTKSEDTTKREETTKRNETTKQEVTTKYNQTTKYEATTKDNVTTRYEVTTQHNNTTKPSATSKPEITTKKEEVTTKYNETTKVTSGEKNTTTKSDETTTRRQLITSSGKVTTKFQELGYYSIELLSGKMIKIKCTTAKYIVSTSTDVSYISKNGNQYKVSKLIVTYNTGDKQVLETVEEKIGN